ncbi:MAG: hypothetical protein ABIO70_20205 [Pseudomonadota bacterium]
MSRLLALALLILPACTLAWEQEDFCDSGGCEACTSDADCTVGSSCCGEVFYCMHQDEVLYVCQLGCYEPEPPPCTCVEGRCRF